MAKKANDQEVEAEDSDEWWNEVDEFLAEAKRDQEWDNQSEADDDEASDAEE